MYMKILPRLSLVGLVATIALSVSAWDADLWDAADIHDRLSREIASPHIPWANPLGGAKPRALVLAPRIAHRETVELMQRLEIDATPVFLYGDDALFLRGRLWSYENYRQVHERHAIPALEAAVAADYDLIIIGRAPLDAFPRAVLSRILDQVRGGAGLVHFSPDHRPDAAFMEALTGEASIEPGPWLTTGVPLAALPRLAGPANAEQRERLLSLHRLGRGRVALVRYAGQPRHHPLLYLTPNDNPRHRDSINESDLLYEYYQSYAIRTLLWALGREPDIRIEGLPENLDQTIAGTAPPPVEVTLGVRIPGEYEVRYEIRTATDLFRVPTRALAGPGPHQTEPVIRPVYERQARLILGNTPRSVPLHRPDLPPGRYFVDLRVRRAGATPTWATTIWTVGKPETHLASVRLEPEALDVTAGTLLTLKAELSESVWSGDRLEIALVDNLDRVLDTARIELTNGQTQARVVLSAAGTETTLLRVRVALLRGASTLDLETVYGTAVNRGWREVTLFGWGASDGAQPNGNAVSRLRSRVGAALGVEGMRERASIDTLRLVDSRAATDVWRLSSRVEDRRIVTPSYTCVEERAKRAETLRQLVEDQVRFDPFALLHGDELQYIGGGLPGGCHAPSSVEGYRAFLRARFGRIETLNARWDTRYTAFDKVLPLDPDSAAEIRRSESRNFAPILDQWDYNYHTFADFSRFAYDALREIDPEGRIRIGYSTPLWNWYYRAYDWPRLMPHVDYVTPYGPRGDVTVRHGMRTFAQSGTVQSMHWGGYVTRYINDPAHYAAKTFKALFNGCANIYLYTMAPSTYDATTSPSADPYPNFSGTVEGFEAMRRGLGKLILNAERAQEPIAILWSVPNTLFSQIVSGPAVAWRQNALIFALDDMGYSHRFVTSEQIIEGGLDRFQSLILPMSQCVGAAETAAIRRFVETGGLLLATEKCGTFDETGRIWKESPMGALLGLRWIDPLADLVPYTNLYTRAASSELGWEAPGFKAPPPAQARRLAGTYLDLAFSQPFEGVARIDATVEHLDVDPILTLDGKPFLSRRSVGRGTVLHLNTDPQAFRTLLATVLRSHGVNPQVDIRAMRAGYGPAHYIPGFEVTRFEDGRAVYYGMTRQMTEDRAEDALDGAFALVIDEARHVYEHRTGRYLGHRDRIEDRIAMGEHRLFALLPYRVTGLDVATERESYRPGDTVRIQVTLRVDGAVTERHVVAVDVLRSDGKIVRAYQRTAETVEGRASLAFGLARNDPPGEWILRLTDAATGTRTHVNFTVVEP